VSWLLLGAFASLALLGGIATAQVPLLRAPSDNVQLRLRADIVPQVLPHSARRPVALAARVDLDTVDGTIPPPPTRLGFDLDRDLALVVQGRARCQLPGRAVRRDLGEIKQICGPAVIGEGFLRVAIQFPGDVSIPGTSKLLIVNGADGRGGASLYALAEIVQPISTFITMSVAIEQKPRGPFGPRLTLTVPRIANGQGTIELLELRFPRRVPVGGAAGIARLRCVDGGVALGVRASLADGSLALANTRLPCWSRQPFS